MRRHPLNSMQKIVVISLFFIFCGGKTGVKTTNLALLPENELITIYSKITNLDSLVCSIIETNDNLELVYDCFDLFSLDQREAIMACVRYSHSNFKLIDNPKTKIAQDFVRLNFEIFTNYFGRNKGHDLAFKIVLEKPNYKVSKVIHLLKKTGDTYSISKILGEL